MKSTKFSLLLLVILLIGAFALPTFAQETENAETEDIMPGDDITLVGSISISVDDDIILTTIDGDIYIIAPAGSFNPSDIPDFEEGALFELEGILLNNGDDDNPATIRVLIFVDYDESTDTDEDGVVDLDDNCPEVANPDQRDMDGDGIGDECDDFELEMDMDNDGVADDVDNCPLVANPIEEGATEQTFPIDTSGDGVGDACEELVVEEEDVEESELGFYCRNRDIEHPAGGRIAEQYDADYAELIAQHCGDDGGRVGWGNIRRQLQSDDSENAESGGVSNQPANNGNSNGNGNGNGNGNSNGNGNGRGNR